MDVKTIVRKLVDCGDCRDCCKFLPETKGSGSHGALLVREEEKEVFRTRGEGVILADGKAFGCPKTGSKECPFLRNDLGVAPCALEDDPARPMACDFFPFFLDGPRIGVNVWCRKALDIARKNIRGQLDLRPLQEALQDNDFAIETGKFAARLILRRR